MSAILGVIGGRPLARDGATAMLARMAARGADRQETASLGGATLGVTRAAWELAPGFSGSVLLAREGTVTIAADATLYYVDELRAALRATRVTPASDAPAALILAAYRAWGRGAAARLEGDFAFVLWDDDARQALCARSAGGKRTLFHATANGALVVASTVNGVLACPGCPATLDLPMIAAYASAMWADREHTSYEAIHSVPAGVQLVWREGAVTAERFWAPPEVRATSRQSFDDAAMELRSLLARATRERLAPEGPTTVWMSGGWDSPAVYGAAQCDRRERGDARAIVPVSISYPVGDPGREDELIEAIVAEWDGRVHWIDIAAIPFLDRPAERAAARDESFAHMYEHWNRALAAGTRAEGSRVAFDGNGGDQYFGASPIFLADLLRAGRLGELRRQARAFGVRDRGNFLRWALLPALPSWIPGLVGQLRGRPLRGHLEPRMPAWLRADFVARHGLDARADVGRGAGARDRASHETAFFLDNAFFPRAFGNLSEIAMTEGVELRSPLADPRVVDFAAARPWHDRASMGETKRLLRAAMRGLLPDHVLAPRRHRTGVTSGFSRRAMREVHAPLFTETFRDPVLARLGIVDGDRLRAEWERFVRTGWSADKVALFMTLQAELWVRARVEAPVAAVPRTADRERSMARSVSAA